MLDKITGEVRVFTREVGVGKKKRVLFNACVGFSKDIEDEYINYYMLVNFSKNLKKEIAKVYENECFDILIKEAWISAYRDENGYPKPVLFVNKAKVLIDNDEKPKKQKAKADTEDEDALPF